MLRALDREIQAVTFDCWHTLLTSGRPMPRAQQARFCALVEAARRGGLAEDEAAARQALGVAYGRHLEAWSGAVQAGAQEMAGWALEALGLSDPALASPLVRAFEEAALLEEIPALAGARSTLERLAERGVRRALVCDTGFTPGRVVRELLDREGLLEFLEVQIFSDEAGMPKPHAPVFHAALDGLASTPERTVHVGDLLRTDIAGAREVGMGTIRIRHHNDDDSGLPEADAVADSHDHLCALLGLDAD
jgi:putative hydrolase of the HAD superfamily